MDLPQNENRKLILPVLLFLLVLALGILGSVLYFQSKNAKIQKQANPVQPPQSENLPVPSSIVEPPELPDNAIPFDKEDIPVPSAQEPSNLPDTVPPPSEKGLISPPLPNAVEPSDEEEIPPSPNVPEPPESFDKIPSSNDEKMPSPLP